MWKIWDFIKQIFRGKTISRILFNWQVKEHCKGLQGVCVDLAGGKHPSYEEYWDLKCERPARLNDSSLGGFIKTAYDPKDEPDVVVDLNKPIPFEDNFADNIFLFNAIYILEEPKESLREVFRILKPGGKLFLSSPFVNNEMPEPHDYWRFTAEGLEKILKEAGFRKNLEALPLNDSRGGDSKSNIEIIRLGERFTSRAYLLHGFFTLNIVRLISYTLALLFDKILIPPKIKKLHPCPVGYFVIAIK